MHTIQNPERRRFLQMSGLGALAALLPSGAFGDDAEQRPPNIVLILADDMGYGDLGCQNPDSKIPTPNLDRLASQGIRLTDAHSPSSVCSPTRYGILTGRYCWRSRLKSSVLWSWDPPLIDADRLTLPAMLKQRGYATACVGKWHLGWDWPFVREVEKSQRKAIPVDSVDWSQPIANGPIARGFDYYFGDDVPNFPPYIFIENDHVQGVPSEQKPKEIFGSPGPMLPGWKLEEVMPEITRKAAAWIDGAARNPETPFFLYFPLTAPHMPIVPAEEFKGKSAAGEYGDFVVEVDWAVGEVLAALEHNGLDENTLVVFTSDNGPEHIAYKRIQEHNHYSMGDLRGIKRDTWEGGHRVPFLARWPKHIAPGTQSGALACHTDLMATLAEIAGCTLPDDAAEDSCNILPAWLGETTAAPLREAAVHHSCSGRFAIRKGDWVYIDAPSGDDNKEPDWFKKERGYAAHKQPAELFNLTEDPQERTNRYAERRGIADELKALLERYKKEGRSVPRR